MNKALILCSGAALLALACNQGDNALFGSDLPPVSDDGGRGGAPPSGGSTAKAGAAAGGAGSGGVSGSTSGGQTMGGGAGRATAGESNEPEPVAGAAGSDGNGAGAGEGGAGGGGSEPPEPVCGNGSIEAGEQCDGGPEQAGCDDKCRVVCSDHATGTIESEDHHCYKGYNENDFAGARQACSKLGGHLATLASAAENKLMLELVRESKFIGGMEDVPLTSPGDGKYAWITGEPFDYTNWAEGQPDREDSRCESSIAGGRCYEHCIAVTGDGTWIDQRCDLIDGYVCEWDPPGSK